MDRLLCYWTACKFMFDTCFCSSPAVHHPRCNRAGAMLAIGDSVADRRALSVMQRACQKCNGAEKIADRL